MKTKDVMILAAMAAGGYYLYKKHGPSMIPAILTDGIKTVFPLKIGDSGTMVDNLQKALINKGGDIAHLIMSGGGVTGTLNEQTARAIQMEGFSMPLDETSYRELVSNVSALRNHAYVIDVDGAPVYASVGSSFTKEYGFGRDYVMALPARTYVGISTGNFSNGMIEISTTINTRRLKFWTPAEKVGLISAAEYEAMKKTRLLEKSEEARAKLLQL
jgi:hypothetical protein